MRAIQAFFMLLIGCSFVGCDVVYSTTPLGAKPVSVEAEEWDGLWDTADSEDDEYVAIRVIDAEKGLLNFHWREEDKERSLDLQLRSTSGKLTFWNVQVAQAFKALSDDGELSKSDQEEYDKYGKFYLWGCLSMRDEEVIFWIPDGEKCAALVKAGILPGSEVGGGITVLRDLTEAHVEVIESSKKGLLFLWNEPIILRRKSESAQ